MIMPKKKQRKSNSYASPLQIPFFAYSQERTWNGFITVLQRTYYYNVSDDLLQLGELCEQFKTARAESPIPNRAVRKGCYSIDA